MTRRKWITACKMLLLSIGMIAVIKLAKDKGLLDKKITGNTGEIQTAYDFAMGTSVGITLYENKDEQLAINLIQAIKDLDENVISWRSRNSELALINQQIAGIGAVNYDGYTSGVLSDLLFVALQQTYNICQDSEGALDFTIRPLADVWGIETSTADTFQIPDEQSIKSALEHVDYRKIELDEENQTITCEDPDICIDLGASGKGYALDIVQEILRESDVKGAVVSVGGSVLAYGEKVDGSDFHIGIRDPKGNMDDMIGYVAIKPNTNLCVSTSGDYEKYFEVNGIRYHHILDSKTGKPAKSGVTAVTIVCEKGLYSDALSTACFVLGLEKSIPLLEKYNADGLFLLEDGNCYMTENMKNMFQQTQ